MLYGVLPEVVLPSGEKIHGIKVTVPNPPKIAFLGLPTNDHIVERMSAQKSLRRSMGRRKSQTDYTPNSKADQELFDKIRLDKDGVEFDEYEAANAISKLIFTDVTDCERKGDQYVVSLQTPWGTTRHYLNVPLQKDLQVYRRSVVNSVDLPHGVEELRFRIEPPMALYAAVCVKVEGYAEGWGIQEVPPHHKSAVVVELVQAMEELDPAIDPNS